MNHKRAMLERSGIASLPGITTLDHFAAIIERNTDSLADYPSLIR